MPNLHDLRQLDYHVSLVAMLQVCHKLQPTPKTTILKLKDALKMILA